MSTEAQVRARIRVRKAIAELEEALEASIEAADGTPLDEAFDALGYSVTLLRAIARCLEGDPVTLHAMRVLEDNASQRASE